MGQLLSIQASAVSLYPQVIAKLDYGSTLTRLFDIVSQE